MACCFGKLGFPGLFPRMSQCSSRQGVEAPIGIRWFRSIPLRSRPTGGSKKVEPRFLGCDIILYGVEYRTPRWVYVLDPPRRLGLREEYMTLLHGVIFKEAVPCTHGPQKYVKQWPKTSKDDPKPQNLPKRQLFHILLGSRQ